MPGIVSSLLHSASTAVEAGQEGISERELRMYAAMKRAQDEDLRRAQVENLNSEISDRARRAAEPQAYHPTSMGEAEQFYKDTHPTKETGPVPGSDEWYAMQDHVAKIRSRYRAGEADRADVDLNHSITSIGQQIDDTRADINLTDSDLKKYQDVNVTTRPTNEKRIPQFVEDSTAAANLTSGRRRLQTRASQLESERDRLATEQRRRLGFRSTTITAGSSAQDEAPTPSTAPMEGEIQQAKQQLSIVFNNPDATPEDKVAAQQAYYTRRQRIAQKYGQH